MQSNKVSGQQYPQRQTGDLRSPKRTPEASLKKPNKIPPKEVRISKKNYDAITAHYQNDPKAKAIAEDIGQRMGLLSLSNAFMRDNSSGSHVSDITSDTLFPIKQSSESGSVLSQLSENASIGLSSSWEVKVGEFMPHKKPFESDLENQIIENTNKFLLNADPENTSRDMSIVKEFTEKLDTFSFKEKSAILRHLKGTFKSDDAKFLSEQQQDAIIEIMYPGTQSTNSDSTL